MTGEMNAETTVEVGVEVPVVARRPDEVDLFMFSAASWLLHRVHYDFPFTTEHDGHEGLLVHGPLQGVYLMQSVERWLGTEARPVSISYRHSAPAFAGEALECGGTVTAVDRDAATFEAELWVRKADGTVTTSGTASFVLPESA